MGFTRSEIDRAFDLLRQYNNFEIYTRELAEHLSKDLNMQFEEYDFDEFDFDEDEIYCDIMKKIDEGEFEYFKTFKDSEDTEVLSIYAALLTYSTRTDEIEEFISSKPMGEWIHFFYDCGDNGRLIKLINKVAQNKGDEYILKILNDENDAPLDYRTKKALVNQLLKSDNIETNKKLLLYLDSDKDLANGRMYTDAIVKIAKKKGPDYIKRIFNSYYLMNKYMIGDVGAAHALMKALLDMGDTEYVKSVISDNNKRIKCKLMGHDSASLIAFIAEKEGVDFIKGIINSKEQMHNYGLSTNDEIVESCRASLITAVADSEGIDFVKNIIEDKDKRDFYKLSRYGITTLLEYVAENIGTSYIKSLILDVNMRNKCSFSKDIMNEIMAVSINYDLKSDDSFIKNIIDNRSSFGMTAYDIISLVEDYEKKAELIKEYMALDENELVNNTKVIKLPPDMTVGVEIEAEGKFLPDTISFITQTLEYYWLVKPEGSLKHGTELNSPILTDDFEEASKDIRKVCYMVKEAGLEATADCGGHIHIGADYLKTKGSYRNLVELWCNVEKLMFMICNDKGEIPREHVTHYAMPISAILQDYIKSGKIKLNNEDDFKKFMTSRVELNVRHYSMNLHNIGSKKNTIEFRLPNGTINPDVWIDNINLFGNIVRTAEKLAEIQQKPENERNAEEHRALNIYELLKSQGHDDEHKLQIFLELCIPEENRKIYVDRYKTNSNKIRINRQHADLFNCYVAHGPVRLDSLFDNIFSGPNAVTAADYKEGIQKMGLNFEKTQDKELNH